MTLGPAGRQHVRVDDAVWIEEWQLENRVLQACGTETSPLEDLEPEIRDEARPPFIERGACTLVDEEALLAVKQERRSGGLVGVAGPAHEASSVLTAAR